MTTDYPRGEVECVCGSGIHTLLRCSRCGKPICYDCMVESPVGYRCPQCASGPRVGAYRTSPNVLLKGALAGLAVAIPVGVLWGYFPNWGFYLALLLGFGVVEAMARVTNQKRGTELMLIAICAIVVGLAVSRYVISVDTDIPLSMLLDHPDQPFFRQVFRLRLIPDFIFMAIPAVIAYIRFR